MTPYVRDAAVYREPKLVVRNLPFQVNHSEVKELFFHFGAAQGTVRLPTVKFDGVRSVFTRYH